MIGESSAGVLAATPRVGSRGFFVTLALITLVSLVGVPLAFTVATATGHGLPGALTLITVTGPMHVAATSFFYVDRDFWPVLRESPGRSFWSVALVPLGVLGLGIAGTAIIGAWAYLLIFFYHNVWLFYHYQRQNFGLISLVSRNVGYGRLPPRVNTTLNLAALGGIITLCATPGFFPPGTEGLVTPQAYLLIRALGIGVYVLSLVLMMWVFWRESRLRESVWLIGALVLGMAFFLPAVVFRSITHAFLPNAIAHGAQYIFMMSVLSGRSRRGWLAFLTMCVLGVTIGSVLNTMSTWPLILVVSGVTQVHFLIDAKVWRLSERKQRAIMNDRFDFLLAA
jgi:hypothetical protein